MVKEEELKKADEHEYVKMVPKEERSRGISIIREYFPNKMNSFSPSKEEYDLLYHVDMAYSLSALSKIQNLLNDKPVDFPLLNGCLDRSFELSYWKTLTKEIPSRRTEVFEYLLIAAYLDRIDDFIQWSEKNQSLISELELDTAFPWDDYILQTVLSCWGSMILSPSEESYNKTITRFQHLKDIQSICEPDFLKTNNKWDAIHILAHYSLAKATELFAQYQLSGDSKYQKMFRKLITNSAKCFDICGYSSFGHLLVTYNINLYAYKIFSETNK